MKRIRERKQAEKKRLEKWRKEMKTTFNSTYNTNSSIGHLPGSVTAKNTSTITRNNISNSAIIMNGDPTNGSMQVNVPLMVDGRDVMKELDEMRDSLLLLKRDVDMEEKYPRLREIKDEYERALEKYKTFDAIKESK